MLEMNCCETRGRYRALTMPPGCSLFKRTGGRFIELEHPSLSAADRESLALSISAIDGVTCADAHRQIELFMAGSSCSG